MRHTDELGDSVSISWPSTSKPVLLGGSAGIWWVANRMTYGLDEKGKQMKKKGPTSIVSRRIGMPNVNQDIRKWFACFDINDAYVQQLTVTI